MRSSQAFWPRHRAKASEYVTSGLMIIAAILSWVVFFTVGMGHAEGGPIKVEVLR